MIRIGILGDIGSGKSYSVNQVVEKVVNIIGKDITVNFSEKMRKGEVKETLADIDLAKRILNWSPKVDIDLGLKMCINEYMK